MMYYRWRHHPIQLCDWRFYASLENNGTLMIDIFWPEKLWSACELPYGYIYVIYQWGWWGPVWRRRCRRWYHLSPTGLRHVWVGSRWRFRLFSFSRWQSCSFHPLFILHLAFDLTYSRSSHILLTQRNVSFKPTNFAMPTYSTSLIY